MSRSRHLRGAVVVVLLGVTVLLGALVIGCAKKPAPERTLWWFTWSPAEEYAWNQQLATEFEKGHPGIKVKLTNDPSQQAMQGLQTKLAAGTAPDVMSIHGAYFVPFAAAGQLMDITGRAEGDEKLQLEDFYPGLIELCRVDGRLYSLPRYASVYALFYNKTLFDRAGVTYPGKGGSWTWTDFRNTAKALTKDTNGDKVTDQWGCAIDFWGARIYPWVWQNGGEVISADKKRSMLSSPETRGALQFLLDLKMKDHVTPASVEDERRGSRELFKMGRVAMYMSGPWDVQEFERMPDLVWEVAPLPEGTQKAWVLGGENYNNTSLLAASRPSKQKASLLGTENYAISAKTKLPDEAWALLTFLLSPDVEKRTAEKTGKMPPRRSVAEGPFLAEKVPYDRKVFVEAINYGRMPPNIPGWNEVVESLQRALDGIWGGKATVKEATAKADAEIGRVLAEWQSKKPGGGGDSGAAGGRESD